MSYRPERDPLAMTMAMSPEHAALLEAFEALESLARGWIDRRNLADRGMTSMATRRWRHSVLNMRRFDVRVEACRLGEF